MESGMKIVQDKLMEVVHKMANLRPPMPTPGMSPEEVAELRKEYEVERERLQKEKEQAMAGVRSAGQAIMSRSSTGARGGFAGMGGMPMPGMDPRSMVPHREMVRPREQGPEELIVCPECLRKDSNNVTKPLSRKRLRKAEKIKGFPVHKNAYCVRCGSRMVVMPADEHYRRLMERQEDEIKGGL